MASIPDVELAALVRPRGSEPDKQVEIQLGHMCNNRCVFCVSGQRTERGQAGVSPIEPLLSEIRAARARGHRKITLLGGEPTLQPSFLPLLRECAALGFEEVVVFTNGAKTASGKLIDEALATGAKVSFRISIQGATEESHERTTKKDGSFGRIVRTLGELKTRGLKTTVNMCLVASNHEDVHHFAELLLPFGVQQLHVDLMRPLDSGDRTEAEMRETLAPLDRIGAPLTRMVRAFPGGFDVNVGNLPFCLAPEVADRIHHDGNTTETIATNGTSPSQPWNKYEVKRRDKVKPERCAECAFDAHCSGIYAHYLEHQGDGAIVPVAGERLAALDPRWVAVHQRPLMRRLEARATRDGVTLMIRPLELDALELESDQSVVRLVRRAHLPLARYDGFEVEGAPTEAFARWLAAAMEHEGCATITPWATGATSSRALTAALARLGKSAPFVPLRWTKTAIGEREIVLALAHGESRVDVTLSLDASGSVALRYAVSGVASDADRDALRRGLSTLMTTLRGEPAPARHGA